jgi:hypothetical protein
VDVQGRPAPEEGDEERAERIGTVAGSAVAAEADAAVDVPSEDEDGALGPLGGLGERAEVRRAVDQERDPAGRRAAPAVPALDGDPVRLEGS